MKRGLLVLLGVVIVFFFLFNLNNSVQIFLNTTTSSGGSGKIYTSGTPASIEVNNDTNTISQNFDGNYWTRTSTLFPVADTNITELTWSKLLNYPSSCGTNKAIQAVGDTLTCVDINRVFTINVPFTKNITIIPSTQVYTNLPATGIVEWPGNITGRIKIDLNGVTRYRFGGNIFTAGTATTILWLQYSDDNVTFTDMNTTQNADLSLAVAVKPLYTNWETISPSAIGPNKYIRIVGRGGNGVADPGVYSILIQFEGVTTTTGTT